MRTRRTKAELADVDEAIFVATQDEHPASLRGVYYRVVSAGAVEKTEKGYDLVKRQLLKLRRSGAMPYDWITDGTRLIRKSSSWDALDEMLADAADSYRRALWSDQDCEVMVFTEKDTMSGILFPETNRWDVPLGVLRGYTSETFCYNVAQEIAAANQHLKHVYLYHFGDHDPSGVDIWRDFHRKVEAFVKDQRGCCLATFERLAVTPEQIIELDLPTRPTNKSDRRPGGFAGDSVQVDAIPARILREIVNAAIEQHIEPEPLRMTRLAEESERRILTRLAGGFDFVDDKAATP